MDIKFSIHVAELADTCLVLQARTSFRGRPPVSVYKSRWLLWLLTQVEIPEMTANIENTSLEFQELGRTLNDVSGACSRAAFSSFMHGSAASHCITAQLLQAWVLVRARRRSFSWSAVKERKRKRRTGHQGIGVHPWGCDACSWVAQIVEATPEQKQPGRQRSQSPVEREDVGCFHQEPACAAGWQHPNWECA